MDHLNNKYQPGNISYENNKITVETDVNSTSVLFEDISSLSYRKNSQFLGDRNLQQIGVVLFFIGFISCIVTLGSTTSKLGLFLNLGSMVLILIGIFSNKVEFENVFIETRGGRIVYFSVDEYSGEEVISSIEEKRREFQIAHSKNEKSVKKEDNSDLKKETNSNSNDILEQLEKLSKLKDSGIITQEEFENQKTKLLSKL